MAIKTRQLCYAVLTADTQSLSHAAQRHNITQSTLSGRVAMTGR
jgi:DNA-binding transcriptional LysR family regulator